WPMLIGGVLIGPIFAVPIYFITRRGAVLFREARRNKLLAKAKALQERAVALAEKAERKPAANEA
ncbi:MAG: hypothetical protein AAFU58_06650, partial [Pseudomonadota bacterium]